LRAAEIVIVIHANSNSQAYKPASYTVLDMPPISQAKFVLQPETSMCSRNNVVHFEMWLLFFRSV